VEHPVPAIEYARNGDVHIAHQVVGEGPPDLLFVTGAVGNLRLWWEEPGLRRFWERLASFSRLIIFDKRGMGLSDRGNFGTLEDRMDDMRAVLDAVGSERAALFGLSEGGPLSVLFGATYPERTSGLILYGAEVKEEVTDDWPWGESTREEFEQSMSTLLERWNDGSAFTKIFMPSAGDDDRLTDWWRRLKMESFGPGDATAYMRLSFEIDIRGVLPALSVPTLVMHQTGDRVCRVENGRYLAEHIAGARYLELAGEDHIPWGPQMEAIVSEMQEFLTGDRDEPEPDRVLATVLFTDIVDSTKRAVELGDRRWRDLLETHHQTAQREVARFRGRALDSAGDGIFASFDGPARGIQCARSIIESVNTLGLGVRAGLHTGECERVGDKLGGIAVHIGARVAAQAGVGEVLVSRTVRDLVAGSGIEFRDRGVAELKGVPGEWELFAVA
jgi:pimeloyl-ACP methyl ester carboxylesterase